MKKKYLLLYKHIARLLLLLLLLPSTFIASSEVYKVSSASSLNIRDTSDKNGNVIGKLKSGEEIDVKSIENGWGKVEFGGNPGYVSMKYLVTTDDAASIQSNRPGPGQHVEKLTNEDFLWQFSTNRILECLPDFGFLRGKAGNPDVWFWIAFALLVVCMVMNAIESSLINKYFFITLASFIGACICEVVYLLSSEEPISFFSPDINSLLKAIGSFILFIFMMTEQLNVMINLLVRVQSRVYRNFMASKTAWFVWPGAIGLVGYYVTRIGGQTPDWWWWTICGTPLIVPVIAMVISGLYRGGWRSLVIGIPVYLIGVVPIIIALSVIGIVLLIVTITLLLFTILFKVLDSPTYYFAYGNVYYILLPDGTKEFYRLIKR